jgi:hypothetical protein
VKRALVIAVAIAPLVAFATACTAARDTRVSSEALAGWPAAKLASEPSRADEPLFAPISIAPATDVGRFVAVRLDLALGAVDCAIVDEARADVVKRRVALEGPELVLLPVPPGGGALAIRHPRRSGAVELTIADVRLYTTSLENASRAADEVAASFETETGRRGDATPENLITNADFVEDDEVRGTPADWVSYVPTSVDAAAHTLRADGAPSPGRPLVATAPIAIEPGRTYHATLRLRVERGAVAVRLVDFDEVATYAVAEAIAGGDAWSRVSLDLEAPDDARAIRLRIDAGGDDAAVVLANADLELVPAAE